MRPGFAPDHGVFLGWRESEPLIKNEYLREDLGRVAIHRLSFVAYVALHTPCIPVLQKGRLNLRKLNSVMTLLLSHSDFSVHGELTPPGRRGTILCLVISNVVWTMAWRVEDRTLK